MANPDFNTFIPGLWSAEVLEKYKESLTGTFPKRDKWSQALRDKALGHPEYPKNMTATKVRIKNEQAYKEFINRQHTAYGLYGRKCNGEE